MPTVSASEWFRNPNTNTWARRFAGTDASTPASLIAMFVVAGVLFIMFTIWEWKFAVHPVMPRRILNKALVSGEIDTSACRPRRWFHEVTCHLLKPRSDETAVLLHRHRLWILFLWIHQRHVHVLLGVRDQGLVGGSGCERSSTPVLLVSSSSLLIPPEFRAEFVQSQTESSQDKDYNYFLNILTVGLCLFSIPAGLVMKYTHRYKWVQIFGLIVRFV